MNESAHLSGISTRLIPTKRLRVRILECGDSGGEPIVFVHGNFSAASYFEELMLSMPDHFRCIAVDLRGYGQTEDLPIDATRGARDWSDDLRAVFVALGITRTHLLGWSAGAAAIMQFLIDKPTMVQSLTLVAPVSPYGFGGTKDLAGTPCYGDFSGSGGGVVNPAFVDRIKAKDYSSDTPLSPRNVINQSFVSPPFAFAREDQLLSCSLEQRVGEKRYPGDSVSSTNWPFCSPGNWGPINALSPKYLDLSAVATVVNPPPILWIRGDKDIVISDNSSSDSGVLGEMGLISEWPGDKVFPSQPMVSQMRQLLDQYRNNGGEYREIVMQNVGHSPFLEKPKEFLKELLDLIAK